MSEKKPKDKVHTLASLRDEESTSSSDEEQGQAFYAGGSEHSGQEVLGPSKKKSDLVTDVFKSVKEQGAEMVDINGPSTSRSTFHGTGYRLGHTPEVSDAVTPTSLPTARAEETRLAGEVTIRFWEDGFTVGDGELRQYDDPESRSFLDRIKQGEVPYELAREARGGEVHIKMEDCRQMHFQGSKTKRGKAFSGCGMKLGSVTPVVEENVEETPKNSEQDVAPTNVVKEPVKSSIEVDNSQPTTTIQIRLADGTRLVRTFNHFHTVGTIRTAIAEARPDYAAVPFALLSSFPPKEIEDEQQTIQDAGLLSATVLQRLQHSF